MGWTVHKVFEKEHFHVLRDIREAIKAIDRVKKAGCITQSKYG